MIAEQNEIPLRSPFVFGYIAALGIVEADLIIYTCDKDTLCLTFSSINNSLHFPKDGRTFPLPSLKLTSQNGWLEDDFPFEARPIFRGYPLVN